MTGVWESVHVEKCVCVGSLAGDNFQMKDLNSIKIVFHKGENVFNAEPLKNFLNFVTQIILH